MATNPIGPEYVRRALEPSVAFVWKAQALSGPFDRSWLQLDDAAGQLLGSAAVIPDVALSVHIDTIDDQLVGIVDVIYDGSDVTLTGIDADDAVDVIVIFVEDGNGDGTIVAGYTTKADTAPVAMVSDGDDITLTFPRGWVLRCVTG